LIIKQLAGNGYLLSSLKARSQSVNDLYTSDIVHTIYEEKKLIHWFIYLFST